MELTHEVPIACCRGRRDDSDTLQGEGKIKLFIHREEPIALETLYGLQAQTSDLTERIIGVNIDDIQAQPILRMEGNPDKSQDTHPRSELAHTASLEALLDQRIGR